MRCWVYIDGFNFYHGAAKRLSCKWVDPLLLGQKLRPTDTVERVKYFTALVEERVTDPDQRRRQRLYWRALDTLGCVDRIEGYFTGWEKPMPLFSSVQQLQADAAAGRNVLGRKPQMVSVFRCEEKGSDVNLAVHLMHDAHQSDPAKTFDVALVLSTDADLAEAIRLVTQEVGKRVYVCRPNPRDKTRLLDRAATACFDLSPRVLRSSVFPDDLADAKGPFSKPAGW